MEGIANAVEENPGRQNIMEDWRDYAIDDAIVTRKALKAIKPQTVNSCWRKLLPDVVHDFTGFTTEPVKEIMKVTVNMAKIKEGVWRFKIWILEKFKS